MNVEAVNNNIPVFKMNENNANQIPVQNIPNAAQSNPVPPQAIPANASQPMMQQPLNQDVFNSPLQMPNFKKMKTTQQIMGGGLLGAAALGLLSSCSSKTWVRMLFTVPVAGALALFGFNMLQNAKAVDKIASLYNNPQG